RLWVLTEKGIDILDPRTNRIVDRYLTGKSSKTGRGQPIVRSVYRDPQRRIWVGIPGGVLAYKPETKTFDPVLFASSTPSLVTDNYVRNLISVSDTMLIAATESGLYALNPKRRSWSKMPVLYNPNMISLPSNYSTPLL